jgi:hypothetical protein
MAFSADELRVLRRALAEALHHAPFPPVARRPAPVVPAPAREPVGAAEYLRLTEALDEAVRESARLRAFLAADLARHRAALPGAAAGYLDRLAAALDAGHRPGREDLVAVRALAALPCGPREAHRRALLCRRCEDLAGGPARRVGRIPVTVVSPAAVRAAGPAGPGGGEPPPGSPPGPEPDRRVPTPAEVWPPRRPEPPRGPERPGA